LIDDEINQKSDDAEETAANTFAVKLLVDNLDNCFQSKNFHNNNQLINAIAERLKSNSTVDPCVLAFNYAWHTQSYGLANTAVKILSPAEDGHKIINQFLEAHLDWDHLGDDNSDHLDRILGD